MSFLREFYLPGFLLACWLPSVAAIGQDESGNDEPTGGGFFPVDGALFDAQPSEATDEETSTPEEIDPVLAAARTHVLAGRDEAALSVYQSQPYWLEADLPRLIAESRQQDDRIAEERLTAFYLKHYPILADSWSFRFYSPEDRRRRAVFAPVTKSFLSWADIAIPFYRKQRGDSPAAKQTTASLGAFKKFRTVCCQKQPSKEKIQKLASEFLKSYPQSELCAAVVFNACFFSEHRGELGGIGGSDMDITKQLALYESFVEQLKQVDASRRAQRLAKSLHASGLSLPYSFSSEDDPLRNQRRSEGLALFQQLAEETDRSHEKFVFLQRAANIARDLETPGALATYRELLAKIMADFPDHPRRAEARLDLLESHIKEGKLAEAVDLTRLWDQAGERDLSPEFYAIADERLHRKELPVAQTLCEQIITRYPNGAATGAAYLTLAHLHEAAGREDEMLAAYKQAANSKSVDTHFNLMDAGNTKSQAHEFLGEYYMQKEDYREALQWWENWEPQSWCGNCLWSMQATRKKQIEVCRKKLALGGE